MSNQKLSTPLIVLLISLSVILHNFVYKLMSNNSFDIKNIEISGAFLSRDMNFERIITNSTNQAKGNLSKLNIHDLKHNLEQIDIIKEVTIQRDLPYTLTINIVERKPVAILKTSQTNYTVDSEGIILQLNPNISIPTINIDFGVAINKNLIADDLLIRMFNALASPSSTNIQTIHIDKNRETYFSLHNIRPQFYIEKKILNDEYITKAIKIGDSLTNETVKLPKTIDIYSYNDTFIGFY